MVEERTKTESNAPESAGMEGTAALQERITQLEQQNGDFLRHLAEFQNRYNEILQVMKRKDSELEQKLKFAHEKLALDLVSALDNLERAIDAARQSGDKSPLTVGVSATLAQLLEVLRRHGVQPMEALGQPFDPMKHQAIQSQPARSGEEANTVTAVAQKGFMIHDRVLRPAAVIVAQ